MPSDDHYCELFKDVCGISPDTSTLHIQQLRQFILARSNGLCPARLLVSNNDGSFLQTKHVCNEETYAFVKRKRIVDFQDFAEFVETARERKVKLISLKELKCAIESKQKQYVEELAEKYKDDRKAFRKRLLESNALHLNIVSIHVCRWDGSPRRSISEIRDAICLYPSSSQKMKVVLRFLLFGTATALLGYGWLVKHRPSRYLRSLPPSDTREHTYNLPPGSRIVRMMGDGNCLYRALGHQLYNDQNMHERIRKDIFETMAQNPDVFRHLVYDIDLPTYIRIMSPLGEYGGDLELRAAAMRYSMNIIVYQTDGQTIPVGEILPPPVRTIHLLYNRNVQHYDSLKLKTIR